MEQILGELTQLREDQDVMKQCLYSKSKKMKNIEQENNRLRDNQDNLLQEQKKIELR